MDARTGRIHELDGVLKEGVEVAPGQVIDKGMLADEADAKAQERLDALREALDDGDTVVGVGDEVAHRQRVGERELERRRGRRRPAPGPPDPPTPPGHRPVG